MLTVDKGARWPVVALIPMQAVGPAPGPVDSVWRYRPEDPYAVTVTFATKPCGGTTHAVDWVFGRNLVADGLVSAAGIGDVQVSSHRGTAAVRLMSPEGDETLTAPRQLLQAFLDATYKVVPPGRESYHLHLDARLTRLFAEEQS